MARRSGTDRKGGMDARPKRGFCNKLLHCFRSSSRGHRQEEGERQTLTETFPPPPPVLLAAPPITSDDGACGQRSPARSELKSAEANRKIQEPDVLKVGVVKKQRAKRAAATADILRGPVGGGRTFGSFESNAEEEEIVDYRAAAVELLLRKEPAPSPASSSASYPYPSSNASQPSSSSSAMPPPPFALPSVYCENPQEADNGQYQDGDWASTPVEWESSQDTTASVTPTGSVTPLATDLDNLLQAQGKGKAKRKAKKKKPAGRASVPLLFSSTDSGCVFEEEEEPARSVSSPLPSPRPAPLESNTAARQNLGRKVVTRKGEAQPFTTLTTVISDSEDDEPSPPFWANDAEPSGLSSSLTPTADSRLRTRLPSELEDDSFFFDNPIGRPSPIEEEAQEETNDRDRAPSSNSLPVPTPKRHQSNLSNFEWRTSHSPGFLVLPTAPLKPSSSSLPETSPRPAKLTTSTATTMASRQTSTATSRPSSMDSSPPQSPYTSERSRIAAPQQKRRTLSFNEDEDETHEFVQGDDEDSLCFSGFPRPSTGHSMLTKTNSMAKQTAFSSSSDEEDAPPQPLSNSSFNPPQRAASKSPKGDQAVQFQPAHETFFMESSDESSSDEERKAQTDDDNEYRNASTSSRKYSRRLSSAQRTAARLSIDLVPPTIQATPARSSYSALGVDRLARYNSSCRSSGRPSAAWAPADSNFSMDSNAYYGSEATMAIDNSENFKDWIGYHSSEGQAFAPRGAVQRVEGDDTTGTNTWKLSAQRLAGPLITLAQKGKALKTVKPNVCSPIGEASVERRESIMTFAPPTGVNASARWAPTEEKVRMMRRPSGKVLFTEAVKNAVDGNDRKAMHPARAKAGYKLLQRLQQNVDTADFDDAAGRSMVEKIFLDSIPRKHIEILSIEQILTVDLLKKFLRKLTDESAASIEVCWHGTQEKYVDKIITEGLNPSLCATGAYGRGAYVGTHSGIAHQYADPNGEGLRHMCCTLVVVGGSLVKGVEGAQSHKTACDRLVNPTQYCFVEEDRLYCSHLIVYKCLKMSKKRKGGGYEDPFQRKVESAICKAARNRNKAGLR